MYPKHIVLDMDGVLANYAKAHIAMINSMWKDKIPADWDPPRWEGYGLTKREHDQVMTQQYMSFEWWRTIEPYADACTELKEVYPTLPPDTDLWFVTARSRTVGASTREQTSDWLTRHVGIEKPNVIVVPRSLDKPSLYAILWCKEGLASLDDYPDVVRLCEVQQRHTAFLMARRWNRYGTTAMNPIFSIKEFFETIEKL